MSFFVKIHLQSSQIEGFIERSDLQKMEKFYRCKSQDPIDISIRNRLIGDAEITNLVITPSEIVAIESTYRG